MRSGHRNEKEKQASVGQKEESPVLPPHRREDTLRPDGTHAVKGSSPTWRHPNRVTRRTFNSHRLSVSYISIRLGKVEKHDLCFVYKPQHDPCNAVITYNPQPCKAWVSVAKMEVIESPTPQSVNDLITLPLIKFHNCSCTVQGQCGRL